MLKRITITTLIGLILSSAPAQEIYIIDQSNLQPVEQVMVFSQSQTIYSTSNTKGIVNISNFSNNDTLFFKHASFKLKTIPFAAIENNQKVYLTESMVNLSEIVVAANKWEQKRSETSHKITAIKPKEIEFQNPQTAADVLASSGEVFVQKSQLGGGSPMIRGFATSSVLLVIDGVRLNNAIYRQGNVQNVISIDANSLDGTEILFGPGSVIYGSDALGGVMVFKTREPIFSTNDKLTVKTNALARYSSANNENTGHIDLILGGKKLSSVSSFTYSKYDDLKMGTVGNDNDQYLRSHYVERINQQDSMMANGDPNTQIHSGFSQYNAMQKFRLSPVNNVNISYAFHLSKTSDLPRYDALRQTDDDHLKYAEWNYGPQKWNMHALEILSRRSTKIYDEIKFINAYQNVEESRITRKYDDIERITQSEDIKIFSSNLDLHKDINDHLELFYGTEYVYNGLNSIANTKHVDTGELIQDWTLPRYPDGDNTFQSIAAYLGSKYKLKSKMVFNAGIRYSYIQVKSSFDNSYYNNFDFADSFTNKNDALNGSLGLAYKPVENIQINANLSSGFQAPNWDGLGKVFSPKKGVVIVPNKELKPQYAYNAELGYLHYLFDKSASIEIVGFYTLLNNPIVQGNFTVNGADSILYLGEMNAVQAFVNADYGKIYGLNINLNANITNTVGIKSTLTVSHGEDNNGNRLRHVAPIFGTTHLMYQQVKFKADIYAQYNGAVNVLPPSELGKDYMYAINSEGDLYSPSWYTLNFKASYQFIQQLQVNIGVENILNSRYRPYSSGIAAPGRNFIVGLRLKV